MGLTAIAPPNRRHWYDRHISSTGHAPLAESAGWRSCSQIELPGNLYVAASVPSGVTSHVEFSHAIITTF